MKKVKENKPVKFQVQTKTGKDTYEFTCPQFSYDGRTTITAEAAAEDAEILADLVTMKSGVICLVKSEKKQTAAQKKAEEAKALAAKEKAEAEAAEKAAEEAEAAVKAAEKKGGK